MAMQFEIDRVFKYHAPHGDQPERYVRIREAAKVFARVLLESAPASAELTVALRDVQRAVMMTNAAIAINEAIDA